MGARDLWLAGQLPAYAARHPDEAATVRRFAALLSLDGDPGARRRYVPGHLTASAFVASPDGASVLLIRHAVIGAWLQPGGHLEPEDGDLERSARREVEEETGLDAMASLGLLDLDIHAFPRRGAVPRHLHYDVRFGFRAAATEVVARAGVSDARWVRYRDLGRYGADRSILRPAEKLSQAIG